MRYTYTIEKAIRAAAVLHNGQVCGRYAYPYTTHLFAVAMIVSDYTDDEHAIAASLLHAAPVRSGYTAEELKDDFGETIRDIVLSVSDASEGMEDPSERALAQRAFIKKLKTADENGLIILAASMIHSMRTLVEEYLEDKPAFAATLSALQEEHLLYHQEISNMLNRRLQNAILAEFNDVFSEYKNFINAVQESIRTSSGTATAGIYR